MRRHALAIWKAGVDAVRPRPLVIRAMEGLPAEDLAAIARAPKILVVGWK